MKEPKKKLIHKLRNRYRLVLINDGTFEEKYSFSLTPINVFVGFSSFLVFFAGIITLLIVFTPLREYIPGYDDPGMKRDLAKLMYQSDSLEEVLNNRDSYYKNVLNIMEGKTVIEDTEVRPVRSNPSGGPDPASKEEKEFRREFEENKDAYSISSEVSPKPGDYVLFNPVEGVVSNHYSYDNEHFAVDIATRDGEPVKAVLEGRVIFSSWTAETGHVIAIQHKNNLVSIYKHNATLLKKTGNFVQTGESIAIIGNTGELSSGPHLHLELWENCKALNPEKVITF